jgi:hypothetical protein
VVINVLGEDVRFFHSKKKGVDRVFIDHPTFLSKVSRCYHCPFEFLQALWTNLLALFCPILRSVR